MAKPLQKERENRSAATKDIAFHPYSITAETAPTAVLLLESAEPEILCQTLRAITRFQAQDISNRFVIFNVNGIKKILPHIENPEVNVRRFALKALAQLCELPRGPEQVLEDQTNMRKVATILTKSDDIYVQEFSSLLLAELTLEPLGCDQLVNVNILSTLFNRMKTSLDPDVQKNCLQTLSNLLADPVCSSVVTKNHQFHWPSILVLMQSKYLGIQHAALRTVDQLICRYKDEAVQKTFRASTGILDLCDILESYEFRDVHAMVLGVLKNYVETEDNALHAYQSGCVTRLLAYLDMALPALKPNCLAVLAKMSFTENGRDALFQTGTDLVFCQQLLSSNINLLADAALGVANMTKILPSAVRMSETNIIEALCAILADEGAAWFYIRMNALLALSELCRIIPKAAFNLVEPKTFSSLRAINKRPKENPIEAQRLAAHCYKNLLNYHISTRAMLTKDFFNELFSTMQRPDILLKIAIADVLAGLMNSEPTMEDMGKILFSSASGEQILSDNLRIEHVALRTALCTLMSLSISDAGAEVYLANGTIHYMFHNRVARSAVPAWEAALEAVFRHNAAAKLHYTGKLDINDFTQEGFYVQKRKDDQLPPLIDLVKEPAPHLNPVLMAAFLWPTSSDMGQHVERKSTGSLRNSMTVVSQYHIPIDHNMREYVQQLAVWFGDPGKSAQYIEVEDANYIVRYREKCTEASSTLKNKAQVLAEFVILQMSGLDQERDCSMPSVELHLADLMDELELCVIGLGWIRAGGALERALLYKVLADRHGIPCSLRRPNSGHAWCEIAVPEMEPDDDPDKDERYPAGLLRENYVVDLLHPVGRLVKAGSYEAHTIMQGTREIRGPYSF